MKSDFVTILACTMFALAGCTLLPFDTTEETESMQAPTRNAIVIAHRGASALRPEHTLAAYEKAIEDGADWIEPDLVSTRDSVLVARHENEISGTTDVASRPEFASRKATKTIDGERVSGWFTEDFTLAELKTLRARERLPALRPTAYDGQFDIATFDEVLDLVERASTERGRSIGIAPEIKHPTYFAGIGLPMEERLLAALAARPRLRTTPLMIQSFEIANLRALREALPRSSSHVSNIRLLQLLGASGDEPYDTVAAGKPLRYAAMRTHDGLREIASYADAIGPAIRDLDPQRSTDGSSRSRLVDDAHDVGLKVIAYTFRPENQFLGREYRGDGNDAARHDAGSIRQIRDALALGIDGFFTDDPALGRRAVDGD
jgi:glycerophosphoryl diester phosphodiesterase